MLQPAQAGAPKKIEKKFRKKGIKGKDQHRHTTGPPTTTLSVASQSAGWLLEAGNINIFRPIAPPRPAACQTPPPHRTHYIELDATPSALVSLGSARLRSVRCPPMTPHPTL